MNIFLLGYRGSGKTTVGQLVARHLGLRFVDVDQQIRSRFGGLTVAEIWQQHGEPAFRKAEVEVVVELCREDDQVIALGGGTLMQPAARAAVETCPNARRFYLHADAKTLHHRIAGDPVTAGQRPSLTNLGGGLAEVTHVLTQREPVYRAVADFTLDAADQSPETLARQIVERIAPGRSR